MTADHDSRAAPEPVLVMLGPADDLLIAGLHDVGLVPVAEDGEVVVWARRREPPPVVRSAGPFLTITDAALALGVGRGAAYELIGRGELPTVRIGSCSRVPVAAIDDLLKHRAVTDAAAGQATR